MVKSTKKKLGAFNGSEELKKKVLAVVAAHRKADELEKGTYGDVDWNGKWKGCAVACTVRGINVALGGKTNTSDHAAYKKIGIPESLAMLEDNIFEAMDEDDGQMWPENFLKAIRVGADLSEVAGAFKDWADEEDLDYGDWSNSEECSAQLLKMLKKAPLVKA
jgi:hypothetical protein